MRPSACRGGTLTLTGRTNTATTETVGAVTLTEGLNSISSAVTVTANQVGSADLTLTSLNRAIGGGTVNFTSTTAGLIGNSGRIHASLIQWRVHRDGGRRPHQQYHRRLGGDRHQRLGDLHPRPGHRGLGYERRGAILAGHHRHERRDQHR